MGNGARGATGRWIRDIPIGKVSIVVFKTNTTVFKPKPQGMDSIPQGTGLKPQGIKSKPTDLEPKSKAGLSDCGQAKKLLFRIRYGVPRIPAQMTMC